MNNVRKIVKIILVAPIVFPGWLVLGLVRTLEWAMDTIWDVFLFNWKDL